MVTVKKSKNFFNSTSNFFSYIFSCLSIIIIFMLSAAIKSSNKPLYYWIGPFLLGSLVIGSNIWNIYNLNEIDEDKKERNNMIYFNLIMSPYYLTLIGMVVMTLKQIYNEKQ